MVCECPHCREELVKRAENIFPNIRRRSVGDPQDRFVCRNCRVSFASHEIEWEGDDEVWFEDGVPDEVPDVCPHCGNMEIRVKVDSGPYVWNWTCYDCMRGDFELKDRL